MRRDYPKYFISLFILLFFIWAISCSGRPEKKRTIEASISAPVAEEAVIKLFKLVSPDENTGFKLKDQIKVVLQLANSNKRPDSLMVYFDGKPVKAIKSEPWECSIPSSCTTTTGRKSLKVTSYKDGKQQNTITRFMIVYSDVVPEKNGYKVIHTFPHDRGAFTQGLVYEKGVFYEGTGENGSSLREVHVESGKVVRQLTLESSLFGEGIALFKDRIYQVTWTSKVGFVYEKSTFRQLNKIYYPTQGWGLTTVGDKIVMSDGTNVLYFYEPDSFTVTSPD